MWMLLSSCHVSPLFCASRSLTSRLSLTGTKNFVTMTSDKKVHIGRGERGVCLCVCVFKKVRSVKVLILHQPTCLVLFTCLSFQGD